MEIFIAKDKVKVTTVVRCRKMFAALVCGSRRRKERMISEKMIYELFRDIRTEYVWFFLLISEED